MKLIIASNNAHKLEEIKAILGVNTMEDKVVVRNGEMVIRPIMNLSLTADHRVVDGSVAAQFLQRVKSLMENPALMLA